MRFTAYRWMISTVLSRGRGLQRRPLPPCTLPPALPRKEHTQQKIHLFTTRFKAPLAIGIKLRFQAHSVLESNPDFRLISGLEYADDARDVLGLRPLGKVRAGHCFPIYFSIDDARQDRVHTHSAALQIGGEGVHHGYCRSLRCRVRGDACLVIERSFRRNIYDGAFPPLEHCLRRFTRQNETRAKVQR
jgi:hypothetical protein